MHGCSGVGIACVAGFAGLLALQRDRRYTLGHSRRFCDLLLKSSGTPKAVQHRLQAARLPRCWWSQARQSQAWQSRPWRPGSAISGLLISGLAISGFAISGRGCSVDGAAAILQRGRRRSSGFGLGTLCWRHRCDGRWLSRPCRRFPVCGLRLLICCDPTFHGLFRVAIASAGGVAFPGCLMCELGGGGLFGVRRLGVRRRGVRGRHAGARRRAGTGMGCLATRGRGVCTNSFYFRLSRRHGVRLACLAVLSRRWPGPGHIGLTRPVTAARRYKRCRANRADLPAGLHSSRGKRSGSAKSIFST